MSVCDSLYTSLRVAACALECVAVWVSEDVCMGVSVCVFGGVYVCIHVCTPECVGA